MIHAILAYVITYFGQAKKYMEQVKVTLAHHSKLVLKLNYVGAHNAEATFVQSTRMPNILKTI